MAHILGFKAITHSYIFTCMEKDDYHKIFMRGTYSTYTGIIYSNEQYNRFKCAIKNEEGL